MSIRVFTLDPMVLMILGLLGFLAARLALRTTTPRAIIWGALVTLPLYPVYQFLRKIYIRPQLWCLLLSSVCGSPLEVERRFSDPIRLNRVLGIH